VKKRYTSRGILKFFRKYILDESAIIYSSFGKKSRIQFNDIQEIMSLTSSQAERIIKQYYFETISKYTFNSSDSIATTLKRGHDRDVELLNIRRYLSVLAPLQSTASISGNIVPYPERVILSGDLVLVILKNGNKYLLSPHNVIAFINDCKDKGIKISLADDKNFMTMSSKIFDDRKQDTRQFKRTAMSFFGFGCCVELVGLFILFVRNSSIGFGVCIFGLLFLVGAYYSWRLNNE
jgi:hypothetical protein